MRADRDSAIFIVAFTTLTVALGWLIWKASVPLGSRGSLPLADGMVAVPVASAMLASRGFSRRRRLVFAVATLSGYLGLIIASVVTGITAYVARELSSNQTYPSLWTLAYMALLATFPLAMLALFVGRRPRLLWRRRDDG